MAYNSVGFFEEFVGDFGRHVPCGELRGRRFAVHQLGECGGEVGHCAVLLYTLRGCGLLVRAGLYLHYI